ncbi:MAG TPA: 4-(cytidine 5'-diphospho)-2-C-methyl-D-erythritol kinase [Bacteroidia bacterium]|nr:4-(cytidine 5'-diphospho)-2-C-methyl-D-erythritol kinase [Bacteroidia bacterium]
MITFPNAKINIGLNIIEKRSDNFHNIESVFYPVQIKDALEVIENKDKGASDVTFISSGIEIPGKPEDNLCTKAYKLIRNDYVLPPVKIHLLKHIPIGAGLGGGSADAAFFIKLLNEQFELGISWGEMHHYARQLGSDCSFFITNRPVFAEGKGDTYESIDLDLSNYFIALVYPNIHVNTATAYSLVTPAKPVRSLEEDILNLPIEDWKNNIHNDFEKSVFAAHPQLETIKEKLYAKGAVYAAMSGSGSTVYGLFKEPTDLRLQFKDMFVWESRL